MKKNNCPMKIFVYYIFPICPISMGVTKMWPTDRQTYKETEKVKTEDSLTAVPMDCQVGAVHFS